MDNQECCGKCQYHRYSKKRNDWYCTHPDSEWRAEFTDFEFVCDVFECKDNIKTGE